MTETMKRNESAVKELDSVSLEHAIVGLSALIRSEFEDRRVDTSAAMELASSLGALIQAHGRAQEREEYLELVRGGENFRRFRDAEAALELVEEMGAH